MPHRTRTSNAAYSAPIVSKAIRIIDAIVSSGNNKGISEIASELSLAKSTTHGILTALEESGWALRDPVSRKYTCGYKLKELGANAQVRLPLVTVARPYLEHLSAEVNDDVFMGIIAAGRILIIDQVESSTALKVARRPGTSISTLAGAAGRIFLAYQDRPEVATMLRSRPMPKFTEKSITDPDRYLEMLDQVKKQGQAEDHGEYIPNVWAIATPIFHGPRNRKRMVAGFWIVGLDGNPPEERLRDIRNKALETGNKITEAITRHTGEL
jgi:DNA-binding IclR family transcriptional regulator